MKVYLVGGAVRDQLLGIDVQEKDWVVVGATAKQLLNQGYQQVGKDFPVFLHPETKEEYALARTERKSAPGYTGFQFEYSSDVSLEQDLLRRDLRINAMAQDAQGNLIDPYGGRDDLQNKLLRHVSDAFIEDPVRVLRTARFAARFYHLGFRVADETIALMRQMSINGEIDALVAERVWKELQLALTYPSPHIFFQVLKDCQALQKLFPEIDRLFGVPQPIEHHPEIDCGTHTLMVIEQAARLSTDPMIRYAATVHDLGKGITPSEEWPKHRGHEEAGVPLVQKLGARIKVPKGYTELAVLVTRYHLHWHRANELKDSTLLSTLKALDAFRRPDRFQQFLLACEADARGRKGYQNKHFDQSDVFERAFEAALSCNTKELIKKGLQGKDLALQLDRLRINAIKQSRS